MSRQRIPMSKLVQCSLCADTEGLIHPYEGGHVCESCIQKGIRCRDDTTRASRALRFAQQDAATASMLRTLGDESAALNHEQMANERMDRHEELATLKGKVEITHGEALPKRRSRLRNTMESPDAIALDASAHRLDLMERLGSDCTALALDAANSINAENSLEKMLAHQLAVAHKTAIEITTKASIEQDPLNKVRMINLAARLMETFQKGLLTLQRIRSDGSQPITVQHVTVADGGQAVSGAVNRGGGRG